MPRAFVYVGKDESSPDQVTVRGLTFKLNGKPVEVSDEALAKGLSGNPQFEEEGGSDVDYGDVSEDRDPEEIIFAQQARITELLATNEDQAAEIRELKEQLGQGSPVLEPEAPAVPADYTEDDDTPSAADAVFAEIDASEDWSKEHHSTRRRWANTLSEGQVETTDEADEIILGALVDREQDQD
jgi:hypothetical protein